MTTLKTGVLACLLASCAFSTAAYAGGFTRGEADTDILYEDGTFAARGGVVYVSPYRGYDTIGPANGTDGDYTNDFAIPSFAAKFRVTDNFSCAFTYTQPFGADSDYGTQSQAADRQGDIDAFIAANPGDPGYSGLALTAALGGNAVISSGFESNEFGGTCAVNFAAGKGQAYVLGGLFSQSFDYTETKDFGTLNLKDDSAIGYRLGLAYEIKEYALRAELLYRSQVKHDADGVFTSAAPLSTPVPPLFAGIPTGTELSSYGTGTLPQSLELNLQSGIAPGWLAFGSIKWTDWSVLQTLDYSITGLGDQTKDFFWRDGWTITGGVGHQFNEKLSGAVSLTWDRGVGTGADIMTDTWTLGSGAQINVGPGALRLGAAVSYLTSGSQSIADGAAFDATADGDWAYALSATYKVSF